MTFKLSQPSSGNALGDSWSPYSIIENPFPQRDSKSSHRLKSHPLHRLPAVVIQKVTRRQLAGTGRQLISGHGGTTVRLLFWVPVRADEADLEPDRLDAISRRICWRRSFALLVPWRLNRCRLKRVAIVELITLWFGREDGRKIRLFLCCCVSLN